MQLNVNHHISASSLHTYHAVVSPLIALRSSICLISPKIQSHVNCFALEYDAASAHSCTYVPFGGDSYEQSTTYSMLIADTDMN